MLIASQLRAERDIVVNLFANSAYPEYTRNLYEFSKYYFGNSAHKVPFGGREAEYKQLDQWLNDDGGPPNFLLSGPAGRGKTALLVHWLERVQKEYMVVFVPISIRFNTNTPQAFYTILAQKLAKACRSELPNPSSDLSGTFRDACFVLLDEIQASGISVIVAIDGLDEATGWDIDHRLVRSYLRGIRILVAARPRMGVPDENPSAQWLRSLEWTLGQDAAVLELLPLSRDGVEEVISREGLNAGSETVSALLMSELMRITEGDPLLLRFFATDLRRQKDLQGRIDISSLAKAQSGFDAYFREWMRNQKPVWDDTERDLPRLLESILALLACAMGPLRHRDLEALLGKGHNLPGGFAVIRLRSLERFILQVEDGYVLEHPRLGEHLRTALFQDGEMIEQSERAFLSWGQDIIDRVNAGSIRPDQVPPYLLQFYIQHLTSSESAAVTFTPFAQFGWLRAYEDREGGHRGFVQNLTVALTEIERRATQGDPWRAWTIEGQLVLNSIRNAANIPPTVLVACIKKGIITLRRGLQRLELMEAKHKSGGIVSLMGEIPEGEREYYTREALEAALTISDCEYRVRSLSGISGSTRPGPERDALEADLLMLLRKPGTMWHWIIAINDIAAVATESLLRTLVWEAIGQVTDESRWRYMGVILPFLPEYLAKEAFSIALRVQGRLSPDLFGSDKLHGSALLAFFKFLPLDEQSSQRDEALQLARSLQPPMYRAEAFAAVYPALSQEQRADVESEMLSSARVADTTLRGRIYCLALIARNISGEIGRISLDEALELALRDLPNDPFSRLEPLVPLLDDLQIERCVSIAIRAADPEGRSAALADLAPRLSAAQLEAALTAISEFRDKDYIELARAALFDCGSANGGLHILESALKSHHSPGKEAARERFNKQIVNLFPSETWPLSVKELISLLEKDIVNITSDEVQARIIEAAIYITDRHRKVRVIANLAPSLSHENAITAFNALIVSADELEEKKIAAFGISFLISDLGKSAQSIAVEFVLSFTEPEYDFDYIVVACNVARFLNADRRDKILQRARKLFSKAVVFDLVGPLVPYLSNDDRENLVNRALNESSASVAFNNAIALEPFLNESENGRMCRNLSRLLDSKQLVLAEIVNSRKLPPKIDLLILQNIARLMPGAPRPSAMLAVAKLAQSIFEEEGSEGIQSVLRGVTTASSRFP